MDEFEKEWRNQYEDQGIRAWDHAAMTRLINDIATEKINSIIASWENEILYGRSYIGDMLFPRGRSDSLLPRTLEWMLGNYETSVDEAAPDGDRTVYSHTFNPFPVIRAEPIDISPNVEPPPWLGRRFRPRILWQHYQYDFSDNQALDRETYERMREQYGMPMIWQANYPATTELEDHYVRETYGPNRFYHETLIEPVQETAHEASKEGVIATHAGMHPDDLEYLDNYFSSKWERRVFFTAWINRNNTIQSVSKSLLLVPDDRVPKGQANVTNREGAFELGYTDVLPGVDA